MHPTLSMHDLKRCLLRISIDVKGLAVSREPVLILGQLRLVTIHRFSGKPDGISLILQLIPLRSERVNVGSKPLGLSCQTGFLLLEFGKVRAETPLSNGHLLDFQSHIAATHLGSVTTALKSLLAHIDLSHICWILTANDAALLPPVLRSRLDIVRIDGPGEEHFDAVLGALTAAIVRDWGVAREALSHPPKRALVILRESFARTRSVRTLRWHLEDVLGAMTFEHSQSRH